MTDPSNDNDGQGTRNQALASRSVVQILDDCVTPANMPSLHALMQGPDAATLKREMMWLIRQFTPHRPPREKVKVIGKLIRDVSGSEVESPVVIRDISRTGAQLAISTHLGLSATDLTQVKLRLRLPGAKDCVVAAKLARVIKTDENFIQAGFKFDELSPEIVQALHMVQHAHSVRVTEIAEQRMSVGPKTQAAVAAPEAPRRALGPQLK